MKSSIVIVLFFALGILLNLYGLYPSYLEQLDLSFYALCALMFCVGITVGNNPVLTILGTLVGCCMSSVFFNKHSPVDCMAVGAGFGYYSLSSIIITEYKGAELGTIALLSNIMREIIALLAAPFLVRFFGRLAPIAVGGATTMDTTLPIITRYSGEKYIVVSIVHGCLLDFSVPFIVTLLCTI